MLACRAPAAIRVRADYAVAMAGLPIRRCLRWSELQTQVRHRAASEMCPGPDSCTAAIAASFDHLIGANEHCRWHNDAKRLCGLQIDHQLELGRLFDRQVGRLRTLENLVDENGGPTKYIWIIRSVGQKEARLRQLSLDRGGWQPIP